MTTGYISEMTAEPIHGGGVTLTRVLGEDFQSFHWFAEILRFNKNSIPKYSNAESFSYPWWTLDKKLKPFIGCTLAYRLVNNRLSQNLFARRVVRCLLRDVPEIYNAKFLICPQSLTSLLVLQKLKSKKPLSYVTWMMDDHLIKWVDGKWEYPPGVEDLMKAHLVDAFKVYVISPAMQHFYNERFGVESTVLCSPSEMVPLSSKHLAKSGKVRMVYLGGLGPWQNDALEVIIPLLGNHQISLHIYSHQLHAVPERLKKAGAILHSGILAEEVMVKASEYDVVVLPISFREEMRNMSYFNIATKFSECLSMPIPTLLIGPEDACMVQIAITGNACIVLSDDSKEAVDIAITHIKDPEIRKKTVLAEHSLVKKQFSVDVMRHRWSEGARFLELPSHGS